MNVSTSQSTSIVHQLTYNVHDPPAKFHRALANFRKVLINIISEFILCHLSSSDTKQEKQDEEEEEEDEVYCSLTFKTYIIIGAGEGGDEREERFR